MRRVHRGTGIAKPSSRRRVDGVEDDAAIQDERTVKFDFHTGLGLVRAGRPPELPGADAVYQFLNVSDLELTHATQEGITLRVLLSRLLNCQPMRVSTCVEINQCVGFSDAAVLARSSGEERAPARHRAGVASMAWRTTG